MAPSAIDKWPARVAGALAIALVSGTGGILASRSLDAPSGAAFETLTGRVTKLEVKAGGYDVVLAIYQAQITPHANRPRPETSASIAREVVSSAVREAPAPTDD